MKRLFLNYFDYVCSLYCKLSPSIFRGRQSILTSKFSNYVENKFLKTENVGLWVGELLIFNDAVLWREALLILWY